MTEPSTHDNTLLEFYFMRHARTVANENRVADGGDNAQTELAPSALDDIEKARHFLQNIEGSIGTIYHTEMLRSFETASQINNKLQRPMALSQSFNEQRLGQWEGVSWEEAAAYYDSGEDPPDGEANKEFLKRLQRGLQGLSEHEAEDGKVPLVVSHGGVWLGIHKLCGIESNDWPENCDIFKARVSGDWENPTLEYEHVFGIDT